jgi:hypothetical protein
MRRPEKIKIQLAPGRTVFNPETNKNLTPEVTEVTLSPYWRRRIHCGDVTRPAVQPSPTAAQEEAIKASRKSKN